MRNNSIPQKLLEVFIREPKDQKEEEKPKKR